MHPSRRPGSTLDLTHPVARARARSRARRRSAGLTAIEEMLAVAAVAACFVYPLSLAARGSGRQIAVQIEQAHEAVLRQR